MTAVVVLDASVTVKWLVRETREEQDTDKAFEILRLYQAKQLDLRTPRHWLIEVAAVISRIAPTDAASAIADLHRLHIPIVDNLEILQLASRLAIELDAHLFDTLYHATALAFPSAQLITADHRYHKKASQVGHIRLLADWGRA